MTAVWCVADHDLRQDLVLCAGQFRPGGNVVLRRFAIVGEGRGTHQPVEPAIQRLGKAVVGLRCERERRRRKVEAVGFERPIVAIKPQPQLLLLADLDQQSFLSRITGACQRLGHNLRFDQSQLESFFEQLLAIDVKIDDPAAKKNQRQDVDHQYARGQRQPPHSFGQNETAAFLLSHR